MIVYNIGYLLSWIVHKETVIWLSSHFERITYEPDRDRLKTMKMAVVRKGLR